MNAQRRVFKVVLVGTVIAILAGVGVCSYYAFFAPDHVEPSPVPPQTELASTTSFYCNDVDLLKGGTAVVSPVAPLRLKATFSVQDRKRFAEFSETLVRIRIEDQRGVIHQSGLGMARRQGDTIELTADELRSPIDSGDYTIRLIAAKFPTRNNGDRLTSRLLCEGKLQVTESGSGGS